MTSADPKDVSATKKAKEKKEQQLEEQEAEYKEEKQSKTSKKRKLTKKQEQEAKELDVRPYDSKEYWEDRYSIRLDKKKAETDEDEDVTDEWYFGYTDLKPLLDDSLKMHKKHGRVLDIGCGLSSFFSDMQKDGYGGPFVGIDYVKNTIDHNVKTYPPKDFPLFDFKEMDAKKMDFSDNAFDIILDKATSDGFMCSDETAEALPAIYSEVARLLKPNGVFLIVSINGPEHKWFSDYVLSSLLQADNSIGYKFNVTAHSPQNCTEGDNNNNNNKRSPWVFIISKCGRPSLRSTDSASEMDRITITIKQH
eukprot:TRINITY_DN2873_c0_g1_i1.p1 TRINITY_DN2873_c0_g1~~TRINITY_DN2873_c0_g1_i1.p1  ORF type:complete len:308 (-),score=83.14 TRINITY_DN2873_c0_g1_i1:125-1048(-)